MNELKKTLGVFRGTALMLNIVLGAGLFSIPGLAFQQVGNNAIWVWLSCACASVPLLVVFALIASRFPDAGGISTVVGNAFGQKGYTVCTYLFLGAVFLGLPAICLTGGFYAAKIIPISPYFLSLIILILGVVVNVLSSDMAGRVNSIVASSLVIILTIMIIFGGLYVYTLPAINKMHSSVFVMSQSVSTFIMVFFAFTGWEIGSSLSEEFKNPKRDLPIAIGLSFCIALTFYFSLAWIVQESNIDSEFSSPFGYILSKAYGSQAGTIISLVAIIIIFSNISSATWGVSRMVLSSARNGLLPKKFTVIANGTPYNSVIFVTFSLIIVILCAQLGFISLERMLEFSGQNFIIIYALASISLLKNSSNKVDKLISILALIVVFSILALRNPIDLLYPSLLVILALFVDLTLTKFGLINKSRDNNKSTLNKN